MRETAKKLFTCHCNRKKEQKLFIIIKKKLVKRLPKIDFSFKVLVCNHVLLSFLSILAYCIRTW